jgi:hypothetical protein
MLNDAHQAEQFKDEERKKERRGIMLYANLKMALARVQRHSECQSYREMCTII